jgi:hypothetical protein
VLQATGVKRRLRSIRQQGKFVIQRRIVENLEKPSAILLLSEHEIRYHRILSGLFMQIIDRANQMSHLFIEV